MAALQIPSGGILPTDTYQDVPINSVETPCNDTNAGIVQYRQFLSDHIYYPSIGVSFDQYRTTHSDMRPSTPLDTHADRKPTFGPGANGIDFSEAPDGKRWGEYTRPVYKGTTSNPLIPLAIIRVAEKNLPFLNFQSALAHLPNLDPAEKYPLWRDDIGFIENDTTRQRRATDVRIRVVFLPYYYTDGLHAMGFYTRKRPSKRLAAVLFTPCTVADLKAAKLLAVNATNVKKGSVESADGLAWENVVPGVSTGAWSHPDVVEEFEDWKAVRQVESDWKIRLGMTLKSIDEDSWEAAQRDGGLVWEDRWE